MASNSSKTTSWLIFAVLILLGLNGYQWYSNSQLKKSNKQVKSEMYELETIQAELDRDYTAALESIENLRDDNKDLNKLIDTQKADLKSQRDKINNLIWTSRELDKAREEIKKLSTLSEQYVLEINTLKDENERLASQNFQLTEQNQILVTEVEQERKTNQELNEAKVMLASLNEELATDNTTLSSKVDMASAIKINFMEVKGYEVKDDGKIKGKGRAKKVDMVRVCFLTETNMVTPPGDEEFFIRVIDPKGETMAVEALGSGVLTNKLNNEQVRYSQSGIVQYDNSDMQGCIDWHPNYAFIKGLYDVEIYNKGYMVGKGNFKLK